MTRRRKSRIYNYDIGLKIVTFLQKYNEISQFKYKITFSALNKLDKFITILAKYIFVNSCLISLLNNKKSMYYWTTTRITEILLRGYEINIRTFKQDYDFITNPLNDLPISSVIEIRNKHSSWNSKYYNLIYDFKDELDQIMNEVIFSYGEGKITNGDHHLNSTISCILIVLLRFCAGEPIIEEEETSKKESTQSKEPIQIIIDDIILDKFAELEDIIKIDNVLGGNDILKHEIPEFVEQTFDEIMIDDITDDNTEVIGLPKYKIKYKGYPHIFEELVI
jgi:hypothetical protein